MCSVRLICVISISLATSALVDGQDTPAAPDLIRNYQPFHGTAGERGGVAAGMRTGARAVFAAGQPDVFYDDISPTEAEGQTGCMYKLKKKIIEADFGFKILET